ncbi:hypothetical protein PF002_g18273 [Phytophthora fragariae]|uniref:Uncharacterized protein n=1 Tax=Phytophthora fragariae TaxID=53985 RepID=A0A6A3Y542_9STRA|nr:hypothetical protein PF002_g18273 [Phytophthora fragariae]
MDRNKKVGPDAWRTHREGSTAGEVSHPGTCRSGGIGLILRFVPLGKSPATSGSSSGSSSIAGVDASPACREAKLATAAPPPRPAAAAAAAAAALPGSMKPRDQQQQQQHCRLRHGKLGAVSISFILDQKPASHIRTATTTSCNDSSNSSIAGRGTARWSWCKPRLEGSRASHHRTTTTTSSGSGSSSSSSSSIAG